VIFDRVRGNSAHAHGDLDSTVNASVNQMLSRTLITAGTNRSSRFTCSAEKRYRGLRSRC